MNFTNIAAIDLGTNSFHLVVVRADDDGQYEIIGRDKESVRLGSGAGDMDRITPEAMDRGLTALQRFVRVAGSMDAEIRAVATSAVREAGNQSEFLERVHHECGIKVDVIPGVEEARLIYLGILESLPLYDQRILMVDIGGGSTEYLIGHQAKPEFAVSLKLGAIRLKDRFFAGEPLQADHIAECRKFVRIALSGVRDEAKARPFETAVGSSGTVQTLAAVIHPGQDEDSPGRNDAAFTAEQLDRAVELLTKNTAKKRQRLPGLDEKRADIIVGGAILLQETFRVLGIKRMRVSPTALREGVVRDVLIRRSGAGTSMDIRRTSVRHLAESFYRKGMSDTASSRHTADIAVQIFDSLRGLGLARQFTQNDRFLLESGAVLHNVGMVVAHSSHHKHGAYIIRNSELLMGFTSEEVEILAQLARYHRKSHPSRKHAEFTPLPESVQEKIRFLSGILRLAIGLDRSGHGNIAKVSLVRSAGGLDVLAEAAEGRSPEDLSLELWASATKADLLESVLEMKLTVKTVNSRG